MVAVLTACLIAAPFTCRTHEMALSEVNPTMQAMEAQTRAADWLREHPGLVMRGLAVVRGRAA